jgi:hypothetical protein
LDIRNQTREDTYLKGFGFVLWLNLEEGFLQVQSSDASLHFLLTREILNLQIHLQLKSNLCFNYFSIKLSWNFVQTFLQLYNKYLPNLLKFFISLYLCLRFTVCEESHVKNPRSVLFITSKLAHIWYTLIEGIFCHH